MTTPPPIEVTEDLCNDLWYATADLMHEMTEFKYTLGWTSGWNDLKGGRTGDDPGDYWNSIITIFRDVFDMRWDEDPVPDMTAYLNAEPFDGDNDQLALPSGRVVTHLGCLAGDGIPALFYRINPPALHQEG